MLFLYSCNPTKQLAHNQLFLKKVSLKSDNRKIKKKDISGIIKQTPNRKILGLFRFHLGVYNLFEKNSTSKIKENIGEAPVAYDSLLTKKTLKQLNLYLKNKGYYENEVNYTVRQNKNKVKLRYFIETGEPYTVNSVDYDIEDEDLIPKVTLFHHKSLIKKEKPVEIDLLDGERNRIKNLFRDQGYYYFNKEYVKFRLDSTIGNRKTNLTTVILNNDVDNDSLKVDSKHKRYYINDIDIYLSKDFKNKALDNFDTTNYKGMTIYFDDKKLKYRPRMLNHAINLNTNNLYSLKDQQRTQKHLSELKLFKTVSVQYEDVGNHKLDAKIFTTLQKNQSLSFEAIGTNSGGNLGIEGSFIYLHKNLFNGGERLSFKLKGGLEVQQLINEEDESQQDISFLGLPFNTLEFGPEVSLEFPRFLLPISLEKFSKRANPKTTISYLLNFQERPEYVRNITKVSFGYFWNETKYKKHYINPINFSIIKLRLTSSFEDRILEENNPFIVNSFTDHFINSLTYVFIYTNQEINKVKDFTFFRFNTEIAGNVLSTYDRLTNAPTNSNGAFEVFDIQYAQFIKGDIDYRYYNQTSLTSFVSRINIGVGKPYGNLDVLPFEKSYYGGGANDIRAWQARTLGPGSLPDSLISQAVINQIGELKIVGSLEYRFDITSLFEGAIFTDAGNIWILSPDEQRPNGEIRLNRFWQDLAIGVGFGLRLDFNFFLIRFDLAAKLKDPSTDQPKDFQLQWRTPTLNLGIGYPF